MTDKELKKILKNHEHYLNKDCENYESMRADLSCADLHGADLQSANLTGANLSCADLSYADLRGANLCDTNLNDADLNNTNLSGAFMCRANLYCANLSHANLHNANLHNTNLSNANLFKANLYQATLSDAILNKAYLGSADLSCADLSWADLHRANLSRANLNNAELLTTNLRDAFLQTAINIPYIPSLCPEEGEFIGWKKAVIEDRCVIVKLKITSDAKRSSGTTRKCRCSKAQVLMIYNLDGTIADENSCHSSYDERFLYRIGTVVSSHFDENRWVTCTSGIHFFMSQQEAVFYDFN